jgi:hypothetical protein
VYVTYAGLPATLLNELLAYVYGYAVLGVLLLLELAFLLAALPAFKPAPAVPDTPALPLLGPLGHLLTPLP